MALAEETWLSDARASWRDLPPLDPRYAELREHLLAYQLQVATRLAKLCSYTEVSRVVLERARMFLDLVHPECCARPACSSCGVLCTACFNGSAHMVAGMCVAEYLPLAQSMHAEAPIVAENIPAAHAVQVPPLGAK